MQDHLRDPPRDGAEGEVLDPLREAVRLQGREEVQHSPRHGVQD